MDITNFSLGVGTIGDIMTPIISKNTILPITKTKIFTNSEDYISELEIDIYQGNRIFIYDNLKIGTLMLKDLDNRLKRGEMKINITFNIDSDGIITVSAREYNSDKFSFISICNKNCNDTVSLCDTKKEDELENIIADNYKSQQNLAKTELEECYKNLLRNYNITINKNNGDIEEDNKEFEELDIGFVDIYKNTNEVINNYIQYSPQYIKQYKKKLEEEWHKHMLNLN